MKSLFVLLALASPAFSAISYTLTGNVDTAVWTGLSSANYTPSATTPNPWGPIASDGGVNSATFSKLSGPGYFYANGIYGWHTAGSTYQIVDNAPIADLETLVFGVRLGAVPLSVTLTLNGTTQLTADYANKVFVSTSGSGPMATTVNDYAWQWDLSAYADITSYSITLSVPSSTVIWANSPMSVGASDTFTQVIPEPSSALMGVAALAFTLSRRRRCA